MTDFYYLVFIAANGCAPNEYEYDANTGSYYMLKTDTLNHVKLEDARAICNADGARLLQVTSQEEWDMLSDLNDQGTLRWWVRISVSLTFNQCLWSGYDMIP